jgi:hypothetical protein
MKHNEYPTYMKTQAINLMKLYQIITCIQKSQEISKNNLKNRNKTMRNQAHKLKEHKQA